LEEVVTGPDGRQLVRFHGIFTDQPNIIEGQIIQESLTDFTVKVVGTERFSDRDADDIRSRMRQRLGAGAAVRVERVESIPRTSSGKFIAVVSKIRSQESVGHR
jgi:phenylacetate-CoA ligase